MDSSSQKHIAKEAASVKASAVQLERSAAAVQESTDRNTVLAADRNVLAAERTYAAWVRTGLAALASGVGAKALLAGLLPNWFGTVTGAVLALFSAFCFMAAVWRDFNPGPPPPRPDVRRLPSWTLAFVNGFLVLVALTVLVGIVMT